MEYCCYRWRTGTSQIRSNRRPKRLVVGEPFKTDSDTADIKALVGKSDIAIDFPEVININNHSRADLQNLRSPTGHVSSPLLLLYPISRHSTVRRASSVNIRTDLEADRHVMGMACVFPETDDPTPVSYVTVDLGDDSADAWEALDYTPEDHN